MGNPFCEMSNQEHARALATIFRCLHTHGRNGFDIEEQLSAMLRLHALLEPDVYLAGYLNGKHFTRWGRDGFECTRDSAEDVKDLAVSYLDYPEGQSHVLAD